MYLSRQSHVEGVDWGSYATYELEFSFVCQVKVSEVEAVLVATTEEIVGGVKSPVLKLQVVVEVIPVKNAFEAFLNALDQL